MQVEVSCARDELEAETDPTVGMFRIDVLVPSATTRCPGCISQGKMQQHQAVDVMCSTMGWVSSCCAGGPGGALSA